MTTRFRLNFVESVCTPNDVLVVPGAPSGLSALVWVSESNNDLLSRKEELLSIAMLHLRALYPAAQFWLLMGNRVPQPDNRVTRHFGLWKALEKRGLVLPIGNHITERSVQTDGGIRFFGAARLNESKNTSLIPLLDAESGAILMLQNEQQANLVETLIAKGWDDLATLPKVLQEVAAAYPVLVLGAYGSFDDPEVAVAVFGRKDVLPAQ